MMLCERDSSENPLLWRCGAKATTKIGNGKPDLSHSIISNLPKIFWRRARPNGKCKLEREI